MSIGVNSNWASLKSANLMNRYTNSLQTSVERITSGARINSAKDDPAGLAVSERFRNRISAIDQASQNLQNDTALLKTADSTLANTVDIINYLKELAVQATDKDTLSNTDLATIQKQAGLLLNQINHNATIKYGEKLISGTTFSFQIGGEANHSASVEIKAFDVKNLSKGTADNKAVSTSGLQASVIQGYFNDPLDATNPLITTYKIDDAEGSSTLGERIVDKQGILDTMLENALTAQQTVGGWENAFGYVADGLSSEITNLKAADSQLRDTDIAKEMSNYVKNNILLQASQFMAAQSNQNAYSVLTLLQ